MFLSTLYQLQIDLTLTVELLMPTWARKRCRITHKRVEPNKSLRVTKFLNNFKYRWPWVREPPESLESINRALQPVVRIINLIAI